jgi:hypothetical protein
VADFACSQLSEVKKADSKKTPNNATLNAHLRKCRLCMKIPFQR